MTLSVVYDADELLTYEPCTATQTTPFSVSSSLMALMMVDAFS